MAFTFIMIPGLLIVLALLVGLIVLLVKGNSAVRWSALAVAGIILLLPVLVFFLAIPHQVHTPQPKEATNSQSASVHVVKEPTLWQDNLEEEFVTDVYSSVNTAAYGLGMQLEETIQTALENEKPTAIVLREFNVTFSVLEQLRQGLLTNYDDVKIIINQDQAVSNGEIHIELEIHKEKISQTLLTSNTGNYSAMTDISSQTGVVSAVVYTADDKHAKDVRFDRRLWIHDTDAFRSQVGQGWWAVFASSQPAISKEQARNEAMQLAQQFIVEHAHVEGIGSHSVQPSDLQDYGFIADEYAQRLQGLSGPIWRAAVLLDVSPQRLQKLGRDKTVVIRNVRKKWTYHIFSLIGMILLIVILSMLVNALTKGYYTTVIVIVAIGAVVVFVLLLMLWHDQVQLSLPNGVGLF